MMLLTSSRKPSFKTKILCKKLALFFDAAYMTRGKMSLSEVLERSGGVVLCIVGEYHGNPGSLSFHDPSGDFFLSLRISETSFDSVSQAELRYGEKTAYGADSSALFNLLKTFMTENETAVTVDDLTDLFQKSQKNFFFKNNAEGETFSSLPWIGEGDQKSAHNPDFVRRIYIQDDLIDFYSNDRLFLRFYIKGIKSEHSEISNKSEHSEISNKSEHSEISNKPEQSKPDKSDKSEMPASYETE